MAQGLRCPNCGHKHPVAQLPGTPTFHCAGCGQVLKTPREYRKPSSGAARVVNTPERPRPAPAAPRPRPAPEREPQPARVAATRARYDETEAIPPVGPAPARAPRAPGRAPVAPPRAPRPSGPPALAWPWRVLVWVIAVPLGLLIVALIARWLGVLNGNSLFDIISGTGMGRYVRVFAIAPFAALVIATMAHVALEQLPVLLERRRAAARPAARGAEAPAGENGHRDGAGAPVRRAPQRAGRPAGRRPTP
jgi:ribosomal protein S27E